MVAAESGQARLTARQPSKDGIFFDCRILPFVRALSARPDYWFELPASNAQNFNSFDAMKRALIATRFNEADNVSRRRDFIGLRKK